MGFPQDVWNDHAVKRLEPHDLGAHEIRRIDRRVEHIGQLGNVGRAEPMDLQVARGSVGARVKGNPLLAARD
jgi:hypothetical protein